MHTLPLDTSVAQGVTILNDAITQQIAAEHNVVVFGGSQSATISSLEMRDLAVLGPDAPKPDQLAFILVGDPSAPNGGLLERFDGLSLPNLGITFSGATPDNLYPTDIYTLEYDGFADFPRYPINLLADLNAKKSASARQLPAIPGHRVSGWCRWCLRRRLCGRGQGCAARQPVCPRLPTRSSNHSAD